jgi:hypothetical protein
MKTFTPHQRDIPLSETPSHLIIISPYFRPVPVEDPTRWALGTGHKVKTVSALCQDGTLVTGSVETVAKALKCTPDYIRRCARGERTRKSWDICYQN